MGMRMLWSVQYKGPNPAIGLRKVEHVLGLRPSGHGARPATGQSHYIQFFSRLNADNWESAVVEALDLAARFSNQWLVTNRPGSLSAITKERKVSDVLTVSFQLNAAQYYQTEVEIVST